MNNDTPPKTWTHATLSALRRLLGPINVCIYPLRCVDYVPVVFKQKPLYKSIPLITLRLLSCNPITAFVRIIYFRIKR